MNRKTAPSKEKAPLLAPSFKPSKAKMFGLSALGIQKAKLFDKPYKLTEKGGLQLVVMPNGSKYFQLRYAKLGKDTTMHLGK